MNYNPSAEETIKDLIEIPEDISEYDRLSIQDYLEDMFMGEVYAFQIQHKNGNTYAYDIVLMRGEEGELEFETDFSEEYDDDERTADF